MKVRQIKWKNYFVQFEKRKIVFQTTDGTLCQLQSRSCKRQKFQRDNNTAKEQNLETLTRVYILIRFIKGVQIKKWLKKKTNRQDTRRNIERETNYKYNFIEISNQKIHYQMAKSKGQTHQTNG